jgi:hypothetical protein
MTPTLRERKKTMKVPSPFHLTCLFALVSRFFPPSPLLSFLVSPLLLLFLCPDDLTMRCDVMR